MIKSGSAETQTKERARDKEKKSCALKLAAAEPFRQRWLHISRLSAVRGVRRFQTLIGHHDMNAKRERKREGENRTRRDGKKRAKVCGWLFCVCACACACYVLICCLCVYLIVFGWVWVCGGCVWAVWYSCFAFKTFVINVPVMTTCCELSCLMIRSRIV